MNDYDEAFGEIIGGEEDEDKTELDLLTMEDDEDDDDDGADFGADDEEEEDVAIRTVVMAKEDLMALLCLKTSPRGGIVVRVDPREQRPAAQVYDEGAIAAKWFNKSVATSRRNGWQVLYDGEPAFG
ncbi:MAG: hypothetical protein ACR2LC_07035 [Pyrinomonadaceae bacterium]